MTSRIGDALSKMGGDKGVSVNMPVNIYSDKGVKVEAQKRDDGGMDIYAMVDNITSGLAAQPGSKLNKGLRSMGSRLPLKRL